MRVRAILAALAVPLAAAPAWAQETRPGAAAEKVAHYNVPLLVPPGMPNPAGAYTLRINGGFTAAALQITSGVGADAFLGITDQLGLNIRSSYTRSGPTLVQGFWNDLQVEGQWAVLQTEDKAAALSLIGAGIVPGGPAGPRFEAIRPALGVRAVGTVGPVQANADALYRPVGGALDFGLAGVLQVAEQLSPTLDLTGTIPVVAGTLLPSAVALTPGVIFRLTPGIRLGAGFVLPIVGAPPQSGQILAHVQLGI